ncbi:hypothetical protein ACWC2T_00895 [Streptomyces sp. NPDC001393]
MTPSFSSCVRWCTEPMLLSPTCSPAAVAVAALGSLPLVGRRIDAVLIRRD